MAALSAQPGLVEVDLLASRPIAIPVAPAPEMVEPRVETSAPPSRPVPIPELLVGADLARADRGDADRANVDRDDDDSAKAHGDGVDLANVEPGLRDPAPRIEHCQQCGAELAPSDIFCGECGFVRRASDSSAARPRDTATFDPFPWGLPRSSEEAVVTEGALESDAVVEPVSLDSTAADSAPVDHESEPDDSAGLDAPDGAVAEKAAENETADVDLPDLSDVPRTDSDHPADASDVEKTRIVDRPARGDAFILQFSTGENLTVAGTGLIGRNPLAEPGEYFDSLVSIVDPGKSVSKTHLEFGQDGGQFWISDRYSANGTVVREPDRPARRGEAGKRYRVVRGTRIDIGEQFFIVS
jgi:pSer/pThr/pTyr-binding forkhead associated (FHA) protein